LSNQIHELAHFDFNPVFEQEKEFLAKAKELLQEGTKQMRGKIEKESDQKYSTVSRKMA